MEYALIAASIALAFGAIAILLDEDVGAMFTSFADAVQEAAGGGGDRSAAACAVFNPLAGLNRTCQNHGTPPPEC